MLGDWRPHKEYQSYLLNNVIPFFNTDKDRVMKYEKTLSKLYILDLDPLLPLLAPYYSVTGAPAKNQPELIRSFILMSELKYHSITEWVKDLNHDEFLRIMIGLPKSEIHRLASYYDLINRVWLQNPELEYEFNHSTHNFKRKPSKKLGKNQKQPPRHPGIIQKFVDLALEGKSFESRPEILMQQIFAKVGVEPSADEGIYGDTNSLNISGDGTCINSGGSSLGKKECDCSDKGNFKCNCKRKFSDPDARWGWDSYHEQWFYGHTGYILSVYNETLKCDIPIYLRMVQAQRYDGVSAIVALSEVKKLYPDYCFISFCGDSAHDNYATYGLLHEWEMKAFIPLNETNKGNFKYPPHIAVNPDGIPICIGNHTMVNWGFNKDRCRIKYRCPLALGKVTSCDCKDECSPSPYGRCIYVKPKWDLRLFTEIPRGTYLWKKHMNTRTASERVNKRLLNDYGLEQSHTRGKKRTFWWCAIHSINILLDARLKLSKFSFISLIENTLNVAA
jgi:hypothetical protein